MALLEGTVAEKEPDEETVILSNTVSNSTPPKIESTDVIPVHELPDFFPEITSQ